MKTMNDKLLNGEELNNEELRELVDYCGEEIVGESRRWTTGITSIYEIDGRFFAVDWERGNTEYQENEYYDQPYEVKKVLKSVIVTEWERIV